jgi:hypothetical protein
MNQRFQQVSQTYRTRAIVGVIGICVISVSAVIATYFFGRSIIVYALGFATLVLLFFWTRVNFRRAKHYKVTVLFLDVFSADMTKNILFCEQCASTFMTLQVFASFGGVSVFLLSETECE